MPQYSRIRNRSNAEDKHLIGFYTDCGGAYTSNWTAGPVQHCTAWRSFEDNPHTAIDGRPSATACHDRQVEVLGYDNSSPFWSSSGMIANSSDVWPINQYSLEAFATAMGSVAGPVSSALLARMMTSLLVQIPAEVELGNFLLESKESLELLPQLIRSFETFVKAKGRRATSGLGADLSLWWQFGLAPLLSDLDAIASLGKRVGDRLDALRRLNNKVTTRRAGPIHVDVLPALSLWQTFATGWPWVGNHQLQYTLRSARVVYRASAKLVSRLTGLEDWDGITAAWLAATGLNNPMAIAYEALPFSFVVDWFSPVGDRLKRVGANPIAGTWDVSDFCWTRLVEIDAELRTVSWANCSGSALSVESSGMARYREFTRDIEFPNFPFSWPLTAGQAELGLSLALGGSH